MGGTTSAAVANKALTAPTRTAVIVAALRAVAIVASLLRTGAETAPLKLARSLARLSAAAQRSELEHVNDAVGACLLFEALEKNIANLEGGCGGLGAASGMAAVNMVYLTILSQGTHVVATESLYGPSRTILENEYPRFGVESTFVDSSNPENVAAARLFERNDWVSAPVVDEGGHMLGAVSVDDVLDHLLGTRWRRQDPDPEEAPDGT